MSENPRKITEAMLHAYVDGVLEEGQRDDVEAYLATHPAERERIHAYQQQNEALQAFAKAMLEEPVPGDLRPVGARRRFPVLLLRAAAAVALLLLGAAGGWSLNGLTTSHVASQPLEKEAAVAHAVFTPEVLHPVEVRADKEKHLYAWLSKRLGTHLVTVHLGGTGFQLVGGRLLSSESGPAAQFMFENEHGARLTLYVRTVGRSAQPTAFQYDQAGRVHVIYWVNGPVGYALAGELEKSQLMNIAELIYQQLGNA